MMNLKMKFMMILKRLYHQYCLIYVHLI